MADAHFSPASERTKDLRGRRYGRLIVVSYAGEVKGKALWLCRCDCGAERAVRANALQQGTTNSCGCLFLEVAAEKGKRKRTHGRTKTPEFNAWCDMRKRCSNPRSTRYQDYGGRGIRVCERWQGPGGFANFLADMGPRPSPTYSIDRANNDGHYCPENCRWATRKEQARNRRSSRTITCNGVTKLWCEWAEETGLSDRLIRIRLKNGWPVEEALTTPKLKSRHQRKRR